MQIMNTRIRVGYPAPNNVILSSTVHLTVLGMQIQNVSFTQITVQDDCSLLVDFRVDVTARFAKGGDLLAAIAHAQARIVSLGIPLTAQRLVPGDAEPFDDAGQNIVHIQCHIFVAPQVCQPDISSLGLILRFNPNSLEVQLKAYRPWFGDHDDYLSFLNGRLLWGNGAEFLQKLYLKFPWRQHWLLKDAYYQTSPVAADGRSVRVSYQPFRYGFGTIRAPACIMGDLGDVLFTYTLRPVMFRC